MKGQNNPSCIAFVVCFLGVYAVGVEGRTYALTLVVGLHLLFRPFLGGWMVDDVRGLVGWLLVGRQQALCVWV